MRIAPSKFVLRVGGIMAMAMRKIYNSVCIYQAPPTYNRHGVHE